MVEKRKRNAAPEPAPDTAASPQPQAKRSKQDHTIDDLRAFEDGVSGIKNWTSRTVITKHLQVIYWFDVEHLSKEECVKRYPNKQGKPCSMTNIFKVYNTYAPRFYTEKGIQHVPLGKRGAARAARKKKKTKKKGRSVKRVKRNPLDVRLEVLFASLPDYASSPLRSQSRHDTASICPHHQRPDKTDGADAADENSITSICKTGLNTHGDPSGIQIPRSSILRHCSAVRESLLDNLHINTITHGPEISADTICRLAACISEGIQPRLPDAVTTAHGTFEQEWSTAELEDLYVLAVTLEAGAVCDLVIDRLVAELRCAEARVVVDEVEEARYFDILEFGPELLNFLWLNDAKGFTFFANVLFNHGSKGYARMDKMNLANWHEGVKTSLIQMMEEGGVIDLFSAPSSTICDTFHHHELTDFTRRLPAQPPQPQNEETAAPTKSLRHTSATAHPRLEDFDSPEQNASNTLPLSIPCFPLTHRKRPQIDDIMNDPIYERTEHGLDRLRAHKTTHLHERLQYRSKKFNAHHDSEETCRMKLAMCREKVALFEARGIEVSDEEVEAAVVAQEKAEEAGGGGPGEDEDGDEDEEMEVVDESEEDL